VLQFPKFFHSSVSSPVFFDSCSPRHTSFVLMVCKLTSEELPRFSIKKDAFEEVRLLLRIVNVSVFGFGWRWWEAAAMEKLNWKKLTLITCVYVLKLFFFREISPCFLYHRNQSKAASPCGFWWVFVEQKSCPMKKIVSFHLQPLFFGSYKIMRKARLYLLNIPLLNMLGICNLIFVSIIRKGKKECSYCRLYLTEKGSLRL